MRCKVKNHVLYSSMEQKSPQLQFILQKLGISDEQFDKFTPEERSLLVQGFTVFFYKFFEDRFPKQLLSENTTPQQVIAAVKEANITSEDIDRCVQAFKDKFMN